MAVAKVEPQKCFLFSEENVLVQERKGAFICTESLKGNTKLRLLLFKNVTSKHTKNWQLAKPKEMMRKSLKYLK